MLGNANLAMALRACFYGYNRTPCPCIPSEAMALPHVRPAARAGVLARPALEAVALARRVGRGGRRFAEQAAQVDEAPLPERPFDSEARRLALSAAGVTERGARERDRPPKGRTGIRLPYPVRRRVRT